MAETQVLVPAAALVLWSMIMAIWMNIDRVRSLGRANIKSDQIKVGARGSDLAAIAPEVRDWPAHNYNHLMEQPTVFYAATIILALAGATTFDVGLAWAYLALRVTHSLWQATVNTLQIRSTLFLLSSLVMIVLAVRTLLAVV